MALFFLSYGFIVVIDRCISWDVESRWARLSLSIFIFKHAQVFLSIFIFKYAVLIDIQIKIIIKEKNKEKKCISWCCGNYSVFDADNEWFIPLKKSKSTTLHQRLSPLCLYLLQGEKITFFFLFPFDSKKSKLKSKFIFCDSRGMLLEHCIGWPKNYTSRVLWIKEEIYLGRKDWHHP